MISRFPVQLGKGLFVRKQRLLGSGLPGISNNSLKKTQKYKKKKTNKTKIQWLKFL